MKKTTLFLGILLSSTVAISQVLVKGISPVAVQRNFEYTVQVNEGGWPDEVDDGTWGMTLDFNQPGTHIQAELVLVNDGTPGTSPQGNPVAEEGCNSSPANAYAGKIAVVRRNTCNFAVKILEAQNAGAIGVIVVNREDVLMGMLGIAPEGPLCTIPAIFLKSSDGDFLISEMQNGPVVMFIGNKIGVNANDMASSKADIVMPEALAIPWDLAKNGTEFPVDLGLWASNLGSNPQTGVTASVDVSYGGSSVYSQTSLPLDFAAPVGVTVDNQYFDLGTYAPTLWNVGTYTVTYTVNGADDDMTDNVFSYEFKFTNSDDVYSKATTDIQKQPIATTAYSLDETTTQYDNWEACIVFRNAFAGARAAQAVGMTFSARPINSLMTGEIIEIRAYEWNDVFTDVNTPPTFNSLNQVADGFYFFPGTSDSLDNIYVPFVSPTGLIDNKRYLFCIYNESNELRIGYTTLIDYTATINNYLQPISPVKTLPNGQAATWYRDGFGWDNAPAISVNFDIATGINSNLDEMSVIPYPNPAVNMLNVPVRKGVTGNVTVEIFDLAGKLVISENKTIGEGPLKVNVASISNGSYVFNLIFTDGSQDTFKVSVNR